MKTLIWKDLNARAKSEALQRPVARLASTVKDTVKRIFDDIEARGFEAVTQWSVRLDGHEARPVDLTQSLIDQARARLSNDDLAAIDDAIDAVRLFHEAEMPSHGPIIAPRSGLSLQRQFRPLNTAGLYVPGGTAPLFSTLIMTAIPAQVAGVKNRICVTPPQKDGALNDVMLVAAKACGLDTVWAVGGAQAIAAMALGVLPDTPRADKLFGPGNAYVAEAKRYATECVPSVGIDLPAGPSELMVIMDEGANPHWVAADLLSQAEHDADAQVILVSLCPKTASAVLAAIDQQLTDLPRAALAAQSLQQARLIMVDTVAEACEVANLYAPEHLSLQIKALDEAIGAIQAAGTLFVGAYMAETFGDYACGPSHVLPTDGAARSYDGVTVRSFLTSFVVQSATPMAAQSLALTSARLARLEGLEAHARAADLRGVP